ncbi:MAG: tRNA (adenosine(37)-N6)-threonylcarbamoyltransferase complex transferase subunit TsaD [Negativicutes bacterium]|jgi:N6-L-threonylcarbamoyladenine synthase
MLILGIETSCDETSAAVVRSGRELLSNVISSQIDIHKIYGGVVPEIASRKHVENIMLIIDQALTEASVTLEQLDGIAVTNGPGLVGALLVGVAVAKTLAFAADKPLIAAHHIESHVFANILSFPDLHPSFLALVVSGGHTSLIAVDDYNSYRLLGQTRDDAAGEAFDKVARVLGLPYPGGPEVEKLALNGNEHAIDFPRARLKSLPVTNFDFSFSGLKSAVINYLHNCEQRGVEIVIADVAASFQRVVCETLAINAVSASKQFGYSKIVLAGGVAANNKVRETLQIYCKQKDIELFVPPAVLCTDNAAMVASRGYYSLIAGKTAGWDLNAVPNYPIGKNDNTSE